MSDPSFNRRDLLRTAASGTTLAGVASQSATAQARAEGPTVYVGSFDDTLYAVNAATGDQEWAFTDPSDGIRSSATVVADTEAGDSIGSRVRLGTLGHHENKGPASQSPLADIGIGTSELAALGGGSVLVILMGYVLRIRGGDADSGVETPSSGGSHTDDTPRERRPSPLRTTHRQHPGETLR